MKRKNQLIRISLNLYGLLFFVCRVYGAPVQISPLLDNQHYSVQFSDTASISRARLQVEKAPLQDADEAVAELKRIRSFAEGIGYDKGVGETFYQTGVIEYRLNRYKPALGNFDSAYNVAKNIGDTLLMARSLERMASVNLTLGDDHLSLKLYYESLPLFQTMKNKVGIATVYNIIGLYKSAQQEYDSAEAYYQKAIQMNEEAGNATGIVHNKGNLGYLYEKTGNYKKAKKIYDGLVDLLINNGDSLNLPMVYYNLSSLFQKQNLPDSVMFYLRRAIKIAEPKRDTSLLTALYGDYGKSMIDLNEPDSAKYYLEKSAVFGHAIGDYNNELKALKAMLHTDTISGNYQRAAARFEKVLMVKDSINNRKVRNNLKASELRYEMQRNKLQIREKELQLKSVNRQKQLYYLLLIISFLATGLLIAVIILIVKNNRKQRRLQEEKLRLKDLRILSAEKSKELHEIKVMQAKKEINVMVNEQVSNALALDQKNMLLSQIHKKFSNAMQETGTINQELINEIVSSLKVQIRGSSDMDLFNRKFSQLHRDFYNNLKQAHPDLTKSELKFCAYLKLNLSSSQIAKIQNVSSEAIRKSRYRIRKKFQLQKEGSLEGYISRF